MKNNNIKKKSWLKSKINWASIILILVALQPLIEQQDFNSMKFKDWLVFAIGVIIIVLRTYFTNTRLYVRKKRV